MRFTDESSERRLTDRVAHAATIEDAPVRPTNRASVQRWQPRRIEAVWQRTRDGVDAPWGPWQQVSARLYGQKIRKDGSDAVQDHSQRIWSDEDREWREWLDAHRPDDGEA